MGGTAGSEGLEAGNLSFLWTCHSCSLGCGPIRGPVQRGRSQIPVSAKKMDVWGDKRGPSRGKSLRVLRRAPRTGSPPVQRPQAREVGSTGGLRWVSQNLQDCSSLQPSAWEEAENNPEGGKGTGRWAGDGVKAWDSGAKYVCESVSVCADTSVFSSTSPSMHTGGVCARDLKNVGPPP